MSDSFDGEKKKNYEDLQKLWFQYLENLVVKISTYQEKVDPERNILNYKLQMDTFSPHAHS